MKKRVTSGAIASLLAAALFTSAAALTPAAPPVSPVTTASAGSTISAAAVAAATSGQGQTCSYVQATTITLQGAAGTYTLDDRGALVASPPKVTAQDCASSTQGKTAAATAAAQTMFGVKEFTSGAPTYFGSDSNGNFNAQVTPGTTALAWGYTVSPVLAALATGNATASMVRTPPNCSYLKVDQPPIYHYHGSCGWHQYSVTYTLNGAVGFPIIVGGVTGHADISWVFTYRIRSL